MKKLHPDLVNLIRRYHAQGYGVSSLANAFELSRPCVNDVVKKKTHKNVVDDNSLPPLVEVTVARERLRPGGGRRTSLQRSVEQLRAPSDSAPGAAPPTAYEAGVARVLTEQEAGALTYLAKTRARQTPSAPSSVSAPAAATPAEAEAKESARKNMALLKSTIGRSP